MSCNCETYECLEVLANDCETITIDLEANQTGTWAMEYEFNGRWFKEEISVENGENIALPNVFNEAYIHQIKLKNTAGELFNDTCYKLNTNNIPSYTPVTPDTDESEDVKVIEYTIMTTPDEDNPNEQPEGHVITDNRLIGYYATSISTQGQSYNSQFYTKAKGSNTLTFTAGDWADGFVITVYLAKQIL